MNVNGSNIILELKINGTYYPIGCLSSNGLNENLNTLDSIDAGWITKRATNQGYSIPFNGFVTQDDNGGSIITFRALQALKRAKTRIEWRILSGGKSELGSGYIDSLSTSSGIDSFVTFSGQIIGWGNIVEITSTWITFDSGQITFDSSQITWDMAFGGG
jgi:hypothetical protein